MRIVNNLFKPGLFLLMFLTIACGSGNIEKVVESRYPDQSPKVVKFYKQNGQNKEVVREIAYYENKKVRMEGEYRNGQRDGKWVYYYDNGNVWSEGYFKAGLSDGLRTTYFENGKKRFEGHYKSDQRVGLWQFWDESGKLVNQMDYSQSNAGTPVSPGK